MIKSGSANILIDGQFGSTGKGLLAAWIGRNHKIDVAVSNASANAGHTAYIDGKKFVARHLPMSGVVNKNALIYLGPASIIDVDTLLEEVGETQVEQRLYIHPRAAIIEPEDVAEEMDLGSSATKIASTRHGVGAALARKVRRSAKLAETHPALRSYISELKLDDLIEKKKANVFIEVPQGFDLSLNSGLVYPYCTCREITVAQAMADCQLHPKYLGFTTMSLRTYPIRVGNTVENGEQVGWSGPCYPDQHEIDWAEIGVEPEITTVTKKVRRVFTFSGEQFYRACRINKPDFIFLNFVNYFKSVEAYELLVGVMHSYWSPPTHIGVGPMESDILRADDSDAYWMTRRAQQTAR